MEELHCNLGHRTAWVHACPGTKLPHRLLWHRAGLLAHHRSAIRKMLMSGLLWAPETLLREGRCLTSYEQRTQDGIFPKREWSGLSNDGYRCQLRVPLPQLEGCSGSPWLQACPCRSCLFGSMCCTKTLASLLYGKRAETVPWPHPAHGSVACSKRSRWPLTKHGTMSSPPYILTQMLRLKA